MELYEVKSSYVEYLRQCQPHVMSNSDDKSKRKFMGIFIKKNKYNYVVPFSSPKYLKDYDILGYSEKELPLDFALLETKCDEWISEHK